MKRVRLLVGAFARWRVSVLARWRVSALARLRVSALARLRVSALARLRVSVLARLRVSALLFLCFLILASCAKREIKNLDSEGENIICFGDSITFGYGANPGEDYPSVLSTMTDFSIINAGIDGDTSVEALRRLKADVLDRDPLLVIIEFGGNDFLRKIPKEVTLNNIRKMVEEVQQEGAMVAIADISAGMFLKEYRMAYKKMAKETSSIFIPSILSGIITNPRMKSDFLHPNAEGYKVIAKHIYRVILPYLEKPPLKK